MSEEKSSSIEIEQEKTRSNSIKQKQKRGPGTWSRAQEKELVSLLQKGMSIEALAQKFKRSPKAVVTKLSCLGLNNSRL